MCRTETIHNITRYLVRQVKENDLSYDDFQRAVTEARKQAGLRRKRTGRRLPQLLSAGELKRFFAAAANHPDPARELALRLLLATACRVGELVKIRIQDVNLENLTIYIARGKGDKDGYVPFPGSLSLALRQQMGRSDIYLFEGRPGKPYTTRSIQGWVKGFAIEAGLVDENGESRVHPHLFRHQTITYLLAGGMDPARVKIVARHSSLKTTEEYNHMNLAHAQESYQALMAGGGQA